MITDHKSRVGDPATSKAAGAAPPPAKLRASQARVLATFRAYGALADKQLEQYVHDTERQLGIKPMSSSGIRTRRKELVDRGLVRDSGRTLELDGYRCTVWEIVPVGATGGVDAQQIKLGL